MFHKLWKINQLDNIKLSLKTLENQTEFCQKSYQTAILNTISEYIQLLNTHYGAERQPDKSLGGWVAVWIDKRLEIIEKEYDKFLSQFKLKQNMAEIRETIIKCENNINWILEVHISSDFHYILIYPNKSVEKR